MSARAEVSPRSVMASSPSSTGRLFTEIFERETDYLDPKKTASAAFRHTPLMYELSDDHEAIAALMVHLETTHPLSNGNQ
jgi:hypothetical protein